MSRPQHVLGTSAFAVLVFVISLVLFHWPFLADDGHWTPPQLYLTMFAAWALVILLVFLFSWFLPPASADEDDEPDSG
ncbi:MAG: hypothetical protein K9K66_16135 [Desulfarculaceae bacterium]|nr:hypothetical protein [Desulfarculaceae bacterium]MCF8071618.1 hypothetical protein [Desulfarculaceae bacterium]MCF8103185.1 hypothetical protein [Desulfarculaceae bacterium]MCF8114897.1 hypothetical protein [Desulfarculaceae bacterium]